MDTLNRLSIPITPPAYRDTTVTFDKVLIGQLFYIQGHEFIKLAPIVKTIDGLSVYINAKQIEAEHYYHFFNETLCFVDPNE